MTNQDNLYNYIFWYNPFESLYYGIERDSYLLFFNGSRDKAVYYKSKDINVLFELLTKESLKEFLVK